MDYNTGEWFLTLTDAQRKRIARDVKTLVRIGVASCRTAALEQIHTAFTNRVADGRFNPIRNRA